ncbi:hypothetical protein P5673_027771 [Acropora cervicornis]|uniref:Uncharacterized protein n=1 Tax=Acropora cervicornis TaxID=6130 RepID=A0AAD9UVN2_ACRCE|nr:hypothetical protein P5673_027771 [Acropora cervicornis]
MRAHGPTQCKLTPPRFKQDFEVYGQTLSKFLQFSTTALPQPPLSRLEDSASEGSLNVTLNAAALGSVIADALKTSFEGLRDSMNAGFTGLGDLIASHADEEPDDGNYDGESLVQGEPPTKKS